MEMSMDTDEVPDPDSDVKIHTLSFILPNCQHY
jgi:hypothetical protein